MCFDLFSNWAKGTACSWLGFEASADGSLPAERPCDFAEPHAAAGGLAGGWADGSRYNSKSFRYHLGDTWNLT